MMAVETTVSNMGEKIRDLAPLAKKLNARTDALNSALETIQEKINALNFGTEVWLDDSLDESGWEDMVDRDGDPTGGRMSYIDELGYGRNGAEWALLVRTRRLEEYNSEQQMFDGSNPVPLLGSARKLRIAAVPLVPMLIDKLKAAADAALKGIDEAQRIAESLE